MTSEGVFSHRLLAIWVGASVVLLALSFYFLARPQETGPLVDTGPGSFSRSALGHAGLARILERLGIGVVKSRYGSRGRAGRESVLVIAEPPYTPHLEEELDSFLGADRVLFVLPKRDGTPSRQHPGWIADSTLLPAREIESVLDIVDPGAALAYSRKAPAWTQNALGVEPEIAPPLQLIHSKALRPVVATERGQLVGELRIGRRKIWVLADPDVMENHGLSHSANAAFAVALINALRGPGGKVVFDETVHGYSTRPPSPLILLFTFPYVLATANGLLAIALLLWATVGRFGKAEPMPPALDAGKRGLIRNVAELLGYAGHHEVVVQRYVQETLRDAARQLHAPAALTEGALVAWLSRLGRLRGVELDCAPIVGRMEEIRAKGPREATALMSVARDMYRWRRGIIDGNPGDSHARRGHPRGDR